MIASVSSRSMPFSLHLRMNSASSSGLNSVVVRHWVSFCCATGTASCSTSS